MTGWIRRGRRKLQTLTNVSAQGAAVKTQWGLPADSFARLAIVAALLIGGVSAFLAVRDPDSFSSQIVGNVAVFAAFVVGTICCIRAARRPSPARRGWIGISVATGLGTLSGLSYAGAVISGAETTSTPAMDVFGVLGYAVPLLAAMFWFPRAPQPRISRYRTVLDAVVITTGVLVISEATVLHEVYNSVDMSTGSGWTRLSFPIADVAICAVAITLGMRQYAANRLVWLCFAAGSVMLALTDSIYILLLTRGQVTTAQATGSFLAGGWMAAGALFALSTLVPTRKLAKRPRDLGVLIQLLPYGPVLGAYLVLFVKFALDDVVLLVGELVLLVLVMARQVIIVYENVNLTRQLEEKVAARTAELAEVGSIVNSSSDAIVGVSIDNVITAWNPAAERLYGRPAAEVMGRPPTFLSKEDLDGISTLLASATVVTGSKVAEMEFDWVRPDGTTIPLAVTISPVFDGDIMKGISVFGQDITERRQIADALDSARKEALESSRVKSEFLATMSHEIRTPMNGVVGLTSLLLMTDLDDLQHQYAEGVRTAGEALLTLINDILDFSKLEAGKVILDPSDFDLRRMIEDLGALLAPAASAKRLELIAYCLPEVPEVVHGDAERIRQIVLNFASNAVKFTAEGEVVVKVETVAVEDDTVRLRFSVSDTGIGIADSDRQQLFESFSQADRSTTRRFGGTGLGLAISRRLVEAMDGEIGLTSEAGAGSTFWFELDLPVGAALVGSEPPAADVLAGVRVLAVDDNATNRTILEAQLTSWKMQPDLVGDAAAALLRLRSMATAGVPYDMAVLDMMMPEVDGLELAHLISADPELSGLPMIMLTSSMQPDPVLLRAGGIRRWLSKPLRSSDLYEGLVQLLSTEEPGVVGPKRAARPTSAAPYATRGRLLIVEDNPLNQLVAEGIVARMGYEVHSVANGAEALEAIEAMDYAAILMDCHMPVMDGYTATAEIRRRELGRRRTPIIAMTAAAMAEDRRRCLDAGMDDYVSKPIDVGVLQAVLDHWVPSPGGPDQAGRPTEPGADPAPAARPVLDRSQLAGLSELQTSDGTSLLTSIVPVFIARSSERLAAMRQARTDGNDDDLGAAAHDLKGASGTIGAGRVEALCLELELSGHPGAPALRDGLLDELESELAVVADQLTKFVSVHS